MRQDFNYDTMQILRVAGKDFLFTDMRICRESVPPSLPYVYEIADCDGDGCICRIAPGIMVNFWGTIIGKDPLPEVPYYPEYGSAEYEGCYGDSPETLEDYLSGNYESPDDEEAPDGELLLRKGQKYSAVFTRSLQRYVDWDLQESIDGLPLESCSIAFHAGKTSQAEVTLVPFEDVRTCVVFDAFLDQGYVRDEAGFAPVTDECWIVFEVHDQQDYTEPKYFEAAESARYVRGVFTDCRESAENCLRQLEEKDKKIAEETGEAPARYFEIERCPAG